MSCSWPSPSVRRTGTAAARTAQGRARRSRTDSSAAGTARPPVPRAPGARTFSSESSNDFFTYSASLPRLFTVADSEHSASQSTRTGTLRSTGASSRSTARAYSLILVGGIPRVDGLELLGHRWSRAKYAAAFFRNSFRSSVPGFPLELAQPRALAHGQWRFFAGMLSGGRCSPSCRVPSLIRGSFADFGDRARCLDHHLHGSSLNFR